MSQRSMERLVNEDLGLEKLAKVKVQELEHNYQKNRLDMCTIMLNMLKSKVARKVLILSYMKDFPLTYHLNKSNNHNVLSSAKVIDTANRYMGHPKFPQEAMFFGRH
jgi:hypothetical protein